MRPLKLLRKSLVFSHRWTGVIFCLLFAWWFISGIFMMYWSYPTVGEPERIEHEQVLDAARVRISPAEAFKKLGDDSRPDSLTLAMFDGRPVYRFETGVQMMVYADTGEVQRDFPPDLNLRTASAWAEQPASSARAEALKEEDQWTVALFRNFAPITKYSFPDGQQVYIADLTGDVIQYTTWASRIEAYLSAIPHWLYFTPLRKNVELWSRIVIWASGIATVAGVLGLIVGWWRYSPKRKYNFRGSPSSIPYSGQKRLHMQLGLWFGVIACTWAFSGMLSMEPFPALSARGIRGDRIRARMDAALRSGDPLDPAFWALHPAAVVKQLGPKFQVKELEFTSVLGEPAYIARQDARNIRVVPVRGNAPDSPGSAARIEAIRAALQRAIEPNTIANAALLTQYDAYYLDRRRLKPLPVLRFEIADADKSLYYVDPRQGRVVGMYNSRAWPTRWLYHGLHSVDLPWLYNHRPAWDFVVLALMLGGTALCVTSVIIAIQFLGKKAAQARL